MYIMRLTVSKEPESESERVSDLFEREILIANNAIDSITRRSFHTRVLRAVHSPQYLVSVDR